MNRSATRNGFSPAPAVLLCVSTPAATAIRAQVQYLAALNTFENILYFTKTSTCFTNVKILFKPLQSHLKKGLIWGFDLYVIRFIIWGRNVIQQSGIGKVVHQFLIFARPYQNKTLCTLNKPLLRIEVV